MGTRRNAPRDNGSDDWKMEGENGRPHDNHNAHNKTEHGVERLFTLSFDTLPSFAKISGPLGIRGVMAT